MCGPVYIASEVRLFNKGDRQTRIFLKSHLLGFTQFGAKRYRQAGQRNKLYTEHSATKALVKLVHPHIAEIDALYLVLVARG